MDNRVLVAIGILALLLFLFVIIRKLKKALILRKYPYEPKELLSAAEKSFYKQLYPVCQKRGMQICPKVRLEDFIRVKPNTRDSFKFRGRIKSRHIDFLICDKEMQTVLAIELDDSSHQSHQAQEVDAFKDKLYEIAGIPLFRVNVKKSYAEDLREISNFLYEK